MPFTDNIECIKDFIQDQKSFGGEDTPEDLQGALKLALLQDWTKEAIKKTYLICDSPCHGM